MDDLVHKKTREELDRPLIDPVYVQTEPNQPIEIGSFNIEMKHQDVPYHKKASVLMRFMPKARLRIVIQLNAEDNEPLVGGFTDWDGILTLADRASVPFKAHTLSKTVSVNSNGKSGEVVLGLKRSPVTITPPSESLVSVTFHLFNFPDFRGPGGYGITVKNESGTTSTWCGRAVLQADGWTVTIAGTDKTIGLHKQLGEQGGYVITHIGRIERNDGSPFSTEQVEDLLCCLYYFLSFAIGRWAGVALPIGFDKGHQTVYEQWGLRIVSSGTWNSSCSWFSEVHPDLLSEVFPGFCALWKDPLWRGALEQAVYWYLAAQEQNTVISLDTSVVLAQTALERIAWTYCVQQRKMVSAHAFGQRGLSAADKLRLLASALDIPLEIPPHLSALHTRPGYKWLDAMDAITSVRNNLIHPGEGKRLPNDVYYGVWTLSLWYLDLVFLRLCGHKGKYSNRLLVGQGGEVQSVPWVQD